MHIPLDPALPPETKLRLLAKGSRGYNIVLNTTARDQQCVADWAIQAQQFDPNVVFKFEQTTGRLVRDRLYAWFMGWLK